MGVKLSGRTWRARVQTGSRLPQPPTTGMSFACTDRGDARVAALPSHAGSAGDAARAVPRRRSRFFRWMFAHPRLWFFFDLIASESPAGTTPSAARSPWSVPTGARVRRSRFYRWMFSPVLHPLLRVALACLPARLMRAARLHLAYATCAASESATALPASSWTSAGSTPASSHGARVAPTPSRWVAAEEAREVATPSSVVAEKTTATEAPASTTGSRKPCPPSGGGSFIQSMSAPYFQQYAAERAAEAAAGRVFRGGTWKPTVA